MAGIFDFVALNDMFKVTYSTSTVCIPDEGYSEGKCDCPFCQNPTVCEDDDSYEPIEHRDDSGIPEWLLQDNATYFRELHRTVDNVPAPLGVRLPYKRS